MAKGMSKNKSPEELMRMQREARDRKKRATGLHEHRKRVKVKGERPKPRSEYDVPAPTEPMCRLIVDGKVHGTTFKWGAKGLYEAIQFGRALKALKGNVPVYVEDWRYDTKAGGLMLVHKKPVLRYESRR